MRWLRRILAASALVLPLLWLTNTLAALAYNADRVWSGALGRGGVFFTPVGLFFAGLRFPFRPRFTMMAASLFLLLTVLFWRRAQWATWRTIASGLAASLALFGSAQWAQRWTAERQQAHTASLLASLPKPAANLRYDALFFQRGVSFTAEAGVRYGSESSIEQLKRLPAFGVNAIALVPYGGGRATATSVEIRAAGRGSWENDAGLEVMSAVAHQLGMRVMLKPHLWRMGPEAAGTPELRRQWFAQYRPFIEHYARLAARIHADIFVVGTEFGALTQYEREWRDIIAAVRGIYAGPLTFAPTQGPEFETLAFWDALDYIGLDNYYPLPDNYSTAELIAKVEAVQRKFNKPVVLTEAGFSAIENAHRAPWEDETAKPLSLGEQARCYQALFEAFYGKPWFQGVYWWKVGTNGYGGPDDNSMTPWRKPAMEVVKRWYSSGKR